MSRSAPTWIIGLGHLPLPEARRHSLAEIEIAEDKLRVRQTQSVEAERREREAKIAGDAARQREAEAREILRQMRDDLVYRIGAADPEEYREYPSIPR